MLVQGAAIIHKYPVYFQQVESRLVLLLSLVVAQLCSILWEPMDCCLPGSLSFTISWSLLNLMFIESVMPSNHPVLCHPFPLLPSSFPSIRVFSNKSVLHIRWPKYWSFSFSVSPSNEYSGLISLGLTGLISLLSMDLSKGIFQHHNLKAPILPSSSILWSNSYICTWLLEKP